MARALPLVGQPYELVVVTLHLLSAGALAYEDFEEALGQESRDRQIRLRPEEVKPWVEGALDLAAVRPRDIRLTDTGQMLAEIEGTAAFDCQLLGHTLERGQTRFSYFNSAVDALQRKYQDGEIVISAADLGQLLNVVIANKTSGPIIRRLLVGLGMLRESPTEATYKIRDICGEVTTMPPGLRRLLNVAKQLVEMEDLSWKQLIQRLQGVCGEESVERYVDDLRNRARIVATRSVEHVIAIDDGEGN